MTFLELCQRVAKESGTIAQTGSQQPSSVTGQTNRLGKIVSWTAEAWRQIQEDRADWNWLRVEFTGTISAGQQRYTGASFGLTRFAGWGVSGRGDEAGYSAYKTATGVSDEGVIAFMDWETFYQTQLRGTAQSGRPVFYTVSPQRELVISPVPDAAYTLRGQYRRGVQDLVDNADTPECPSEHHMAIVWGALTMLAEHDEAVTQNPAWMRRYRAAMSDLRRDCLPALTLGGPLV